MPAADTDVVARAQAITWPAPTEAPARPRVPDAKPLPPVPSWPEVRTELDVAIERIALDQATPQQALADAQARCQAALDKFLQRQAARAGRR